MNIIIDLIIAFLIIISLVLALFSKKLRIKNNNSFQMLFIGIALLLISINTLSMFYKIACIVIGLYNIIISIMKIKKAKNEFIDNSR